MKPNRQAAILQLIESKNIETQEQILLELEKLGFSTTQATISRDIKELRLIKELNEDGEYHYSTAARQTETGSTEKLNSIFCQCVLTCDHAQNIVVLKTMPGMANAACSAIDNMGFDMVIGTIAGDDTAFLLLRDSASATALCSDIRRQLA